MAIWTNRSDAWNRPSSRSDSWDPPTPDSNAWDRPARQYTEPSRWRAGIARTLGILGIIGTVALAAYAFAPRSQAIALKFDKLADGVALPWDPKLAPGPEPLALDRGAGSASASAASSGDGSVVSPLQASSVDVVPEGPSSVALEALSGAAATEAAAPAVVPEPAPIAVEPPVALSPSRESTPGASPAASPSPEAKLESSAASSVARARTARPPAESRVYGESPGEPGFTDDEIQRRKDRYESWLKEQGLERIQ